MPKYCECRISSPSAHHNCCINDGCGKEIKTIYEKYSELEQQLKEAESVIEFYSDHLHVDYNTKKAREYLTKYKINE